MGQKCILEDIFPKNEIFRDFDQNQCNFFSIEYSETVEYSTAPEIFEQIQNVVKNSGVFFQII